MPALFILFIDVHRIIPAQIEMKIPQAARDGLGDRCSIEFISSLSAIWHG